MLLINFFIGYTLYRVVDVAEVVESERTDLNSSALTQPSPKHNEEEAESLINHYSLEKSKIEQKEYIVKRLQGIFLG
jgi:hypothetical protein